MKIGDFGLSRALNNLNQENAQNQIETISTDETSGTDTIPKQSNLINGSADKSKSKIAGTMLYLAPEVKNRALYKEIDLAHKQDFEKKQDIYALGLILLELAVSFSTQSERVQVFSKVKA